MESLDLTFSAAKDGSDGTEVVDLIEGGRDIEVTDNNKQEYIDYMVLHLTKGRIRRQAGLTREGIELCLSRELLASFTERELSFIIAGNPTFSYEEWREASRINSYQDHDESVIEWFWQFVSRLSQMERGLLFRFATGSSRLPPGGFYGLKPAFLITIVPFVENKPLPTAATCFNHLKLPR